MFATAIILLRITTIGSSTETDRLVGHVHKAVEILAAMDESIVARRSIEIINHHLREIRASAADSVGNTHIHDQSYTTVPQADPIEMLLPVSLLYEHGLCPLRSNAYNLGTALRTWTSRLHIRSDGRALRQLERLSDHERTGHIRDKALLYAESLQVAAAKYNLCRSFLLLSTNRILGG